MFDEYFQASMNVDHLVSEALSLVSVGSTGSSSFFSIDQDAPSWSIYQTTLTTYSPVIPQGVDDDYRNIEVAHMINDPFSCSLITDYGSSNVHVVNQP